LRFLRSLVVPLCAALFAALCAHNAIDLAGDYLLPHDTYDDIAHVSRTLFGGATVALVAVVLGIAFRGAIHEASGREAAFCDALGALGPKDARWFFGIVTGLTIVLVLAMQSLDCLLAGTEIDDIGDLFGGSLLLGSLCSFASAVFCGACARFVYARAAQFRRTFLAVASAFVRPGHGAETMSGCSRTQVRVVPTPGIRRGRPSAGRAPPLLALVR
jgi:hypothetical protein